MMLVRTIIVAMVLAGPVHSSAEDADRTGDEATTKAAAVLAEAERHVDRLKEHAKQGAVPSARVDQAEIELTEARIRMATLQGNTKDLLDGLGVLVAHRERRWELIQQAAASGAIPKRRVSESRIELAEARIRLELHTLMAVRERDFAVLKTAGDQGAVPQRVVDDASKTINLFRDPVTSVSDETPVAIADEIDPPTDKIRDLLQKRLVVLVEIHERAVKAFEAGEAGVDKVDQSRTALLAGRLDLALTQAERIQILEEMVQQAEEWLKTVGKLAMDQQISAADLLKAKVHFLEAQIALEKQRGTK